MAWLVELFQGRSVAAAVLILSLVAASGLMLGRVKVRGVGLGIAGVLFTGLLFGHFDVTFDSQMMEFTREFGLILFVYTIGMQLGPGFFDSLRRQGLAFNLLAAGVVVLGVLATWLAIRFGHLSVPVAVGLMSGATTNTPSLAAAQQALKDVPGFAGEAAKLPGLGYAVAYPFGIVGIILAMQVTRLVARVDLQAEARALDLQQENGAESRLGRMHLRVKNPNLAGMPLEDVPLWAEHGIVVSRILHDGTVRLAQPDTPLALDDVLLAVGPVARLHEFQLLIGTEEAALDLTRLGRDITTRSMVVTKQQPLGKTVEELNFQGRYGVIVTRVRRAGIEFTPSSVVTLHYGDTVLGVGEPGALDKVSEELGNVARQVSIPEIIPVFVGIALGVLLGSWPFHVPGVAAPVRLGLAGGPLLAAIVLSNTSHIGPLIWHLPLSANLVLREIGIVLFLASVGLQAGDRFVESLVQGSGLYWMLLAAGITLAPLLVGALVGRAVMKLNFLSLCGLLAGSMTDPPALAFAGALTGSEAPAVAYATVYPLTMILRVLSAQLLVTALAGPGGL